MNIVVIVVIIRVIVLIFINDYKILYLSFTIIRYLILINDYKSFYSLI